MSEILLWFIAFCVILGIEMIFSTIYLLALAAGSLAAALTCLAGNNTAAHVTTAAIVTIAGIGIAYLTIKRRKQRREQDLNEPDCGREVKVEKVFDGRARVNYRGTFWDALAEDGELTPGIWFIARVDGTRLILQKASTLKKEHAQE